MANEEHDPRDQQPQQPTAPERPADYPTNNPGTRDANPKPQT
jgi:hypothetical protein